MGGFIGARKPVDGKPEIKFQFLRGKAFCS